MGEASFGCVNHFRRERERGIRLRNFVLEVRGYGWGMEAEKVNAGSKEKKCRPERLEYLDQLVTEFHTTKSKDAKEQILANLSNFAYDPVNYDYFRKLNVLGLFLDTLSDEEENLTKYSIGGLCNLSLDAANKEFINKNGLSKITKLLHHNNIDVVLSTITTLMFLVTPESKSEITNTQVVRTMLRLSKLGNSRLENLTAIFLEDYCTEEQIREASICDLSDVPLPNS